MAADGERSPAACAWCGAGWDRAAKQPPRPHSLRLVRGRDHRPLAERGGARAGLCHLPAGVGPLRRGRRCAAAPDPGPARRPGRPDRTPRAGPRRRRRRRHAARRAAGAGPEAARARARLAPRRRARRRHLRGRRRVGGGRLLALARAPARPRGGDRPRRRSSRPGRRPAGRHPEHRQPAGARLRRPLAPSRPAAPSGPPARRGADRPPARARADGRAGQPLARRAGRVRLAARLGRDASRPARPLRRDPAPGGAQAADAGPPRRAAALATALVLFPLAAVASAVEWRPAAAARSTSRRGATERAFGAKMVLGLKWAAQGVDAEGCRVERMWPTVP